jgi:hypothetical protein
MVRVEAGRRERRNPDKIARIGFFIPFALAAGKNETAEQNIRVFVTAWFSIGSRRNPIMGVENNTTTIMTERPLSGEHRLLDGGCAFRSRCWPEDIYRSQESGRTRAPP